MKKTFFMLAISLLACITLCNAQYKIDNLELNYGTELADDGYKIVKVIGEKSDKIFTLAIRGKDSYALKTFSSDAMGLLSTYPIEFPELQDKDLDFEEIYIIKDKLYALGSVYFRKEKKYRLVATEISDTGKLGENIVLFESEVEKNSERGGFYFKLGVNEDEILIMHACYYKKEEAFKYELKLFDGSLKLKFSDVDKIPVDDNKRNYEFNISDFEVNYNGDTFLVVNEGYRDNKKKERVENFLVYVYKRENNYKKEVVNINVKDKSIVNCKMMSTAKNTLKLVGFFADVSESGREKIDFKGVYNASIDLSDNTSQIHFNDFDLATKTKLIGERRANKGKDVKPFYVIHSIVERNDGGLIFLAEYAMVQSVTQNSIGPLALTTVNYVTNEIIVTSMNPDGTLDWSNVVPKNQDASVSTLTIFVSGYFGNGFSVSVAFNIPLTSLCKGPEYLSAIPIYKDGKLYVLFNDSEKNIGETNIDKIKNWGNYNKTNPTVFIMDEDGNLVRKDPEEVVKDDLVIRPGVYYRKSNDEYIIYSSRKKQDKLGRLFLN